MHISTPRLAAQQVPEYIWQGWTCSVRFVSYAITPGETQKYDGGVNYFKQFMNKKCSF